MTRRPGFRTSEFLVGVLTLVGSIAAAWNNNVTDTQGFYGAVAGALAYIVSRGLAKYEPRSPAGTDPSSTPPTQ